MRLFLPTLILCLCCLAVPAAAASPEVVVSFQALGERTAAFTDPAGASKAVLAIDLGSSISGSHSLKSTAPKLDAGRYRMTLYARLTAPPDDDLSRMRFDWSVGDGKKSLVKRSFMWTQFDSTPNRYTPLQLDITLLQPTVPSFDLGWLQVASASADKVRPLRKTEPPTDPKFATATPKKPKSLLGDGDDLLSELNAPKVAPPIASLTYPALLIDRVTFEPVGGGQWIEAVRPQFVHVYPNAANPIEIVVRNRDSRTVQATVQLELRGGLDETLHTTSQTLELSPTAATTCKFDWPGSPREFGIEARATLVVDGKPIHTASDYYSCSDPIWKTALQASGFLDWYGREPFMVEHVEQNRAKYLNVEEAFSWQPSSWTDLNPKSDHWWTGQGDAHNNVAGLKLWMDTSHQHGIKMITYLWPTASGPEGIEWGRAAPELVTHSGVGLPTEFFDVEDLRLKSITEANPRLWDLRSGIWNYIGINRGLLRSMEKGVDETIASAKRIGWDGARFDKPPSWSAMDAAEVHGEFALMKVEKLMQQLIPEYYDQREGQWSEEAVSVANARYCLHRFKEHDPHFALSYNRGAVNEATDRDLKFVDVLCAPGGQIMDEQIRQVVRGPWKDYFERIRGEADFTRRRGGYHCCVAASGMTASMRCYAALALFIGGSHPYGDYGWASPLPGHYTHFMTRYGEYCWAGDLEPTTGEAEQFAVDDDATLWWRDFTRRRPTADGGTQWVVHLVSAPPADDMAPPSPGQMKPWRRNVAVGRKTNVEPTAWALSAEPTTHAEKLTPRKAGDRYVVEVPEHRVWTMLVWNETQAGAAK
jgi:hypothetical protein